VRPFAGILPFPDPRGLASSLASVRRHRRRDHTARAWIIGWSLQVCVHC